MTTPGLTDASAGVQLVDTMEHLFLPALTLTLALIGEYALIMRSSIMEAMNEEYVTTARAKGCVRPWSCASTSSPMPFCPS